MEDPTAIVMFHETVLDGQCRHKRTTMFACFIVLHIKAISIIWGTGIRGLMRGMATLPQGNQELLVVRDKVGRPPGGLGVSKSMECDIFPFSALTLLVG